MKKDHYSNVIRPIQLTLAIIFSAFLLLVSCSEDEEPPEPGVVEADVPEFAVVNVPVTLLDRSNNAASRTWTIQDGSPATSTDRSASVTFSSAGSKTISLDVVFDNGTTNSETFTIEIAEELNADITATETAVFLENDVEFSVTFEANVVGGPDGYLWSFPGGTPETSTEASPTVTWLGGGNPEVSLTITRSKDNASLEVTGSLQVGPENLFTNDFWGFEAEDVVAALQTWDGDAGGPWEPGVIAALADGYEGKAIEVNYPGDKGYYGVISRDNAAVNASLNIGDIVLFSYYVKTATDGANLQFSRIVNHAPSWWEDAPPAGFEGFTAADAQEYQFWTNIGPVTDIGSDWTRISTLDTLDNLNYAEAVNVFPEFGFGGDPAIFSIDKVELKRLGNVND